MKVDELVTVIMSLPQTRQSDHAKSPDYRVAGKIFATLASTQNLVLKLTMEQQEMVVSSAPEIYSPVEGTWGERGWTNARIAQLDETSALSSLIMAWTNVAPLAVRKHAAS